MLFIENWKWQANNSGYSTSYKFLMHLSVCFTNIFQFIKYFVNRRSLVKGKLEARLEMMKNIFKYILNVLRMFFLI